MPRCTTARDRVLRLQEDISRDMSRISDFARASKLPLKKIVEADLVYSALAKRKAVCQLWLDTHSVHRGKLSLLERLGYFEMYPCHTCPVNGDVPDELEVTLEIAIGA